MFITEYTNFTQNLVSNLKKDERVIGLVALGSMAQQDYFPDQWSDHDFFVITVPGAQNTYRSNLNWLPDYTNILFYFQETDHGLKVIYQNGHLLEFAIFDQEELNLASVNRYKVLIDQCDIEKQLQNIKKRSEESSNSIKVDDKLLFGMFISSLIVGVGRFNRGERLSGHEFVKMYAVTHLLRLIEKHKPSPSNDVYLLDNFNPWRRFERVYPELGSDINDILSLEVPSSAKALLELTRRELIDYLPDYFSEAIAVVTKQIEKI